MSTCFNIPSASSIQTNPLIGMPSIHEGVPSRLRSINAVSTANFTAGRECGMDSGCNESSFVSCSKASLAPFSDSRLRPGIKLHSPVPLRPSSSSIDKKKQGLLINVSREVRAGLLNSKGCDVNSMVAIVIL